MNRLTVGGATVAVAAEGRGRWSTTRRARLFARATGWPVLSIVPAPLAAAPAEPARPSFDSGRGWWVSERQGGWSISFWDDHRRPSPALCQVLSVDRSWSSGHLYLSPAFTGPGARPFWLWYPLEQLLFTTLLGRSRGAVVHASAIVSDGVGWVFAGTHGAGKSTTAALFAGRPNTVVLSDDRVVVRRVGGAWEVFGTPWAGTVMKASPLSAPVGGILFLRHGPPTTATPLLAASAATRLLARCFHPYWDRCALDGLLETVTSIALDVPCYDFPFVPDADAIVAALPRLRGGAPGL